jgi:hypothetical protein
MRDNRGPMQKNGHLGPRERDTSESDKSLAGKSERRVKRCKQENTLMQTKINFDDSPQKITAIPFIRTYLLHSSKLVIDGLSITLLL